MAFTNGSAWLHILNILYFEVQIVDFYDVGGGVTSCSEITMFALCRALCPEGVTLRGLESLANASLVVVAVPRCLFINLK